MKLIKIFILFVTLSFVVGVGSAFNGSDASVQKSNETKIFSESELKEENVGNDNIVDEEKIENIEENNFVSKEKSMEEDIKESVNNTEEVNNAQQPDIKKQEEKSMNENKIENNSQKEISSNSTNTNNTQQIWEKIGISEYDYYNTPMYKYETVTHDTEEKCNSAGNLATASKIDPNTNMSYQEYTDYWCYEVISYSGRTLGYMLKLS